MNTHKDKGEEQKLNEVTITVCGETDPCAWHKRPDVGAYHCSYCCPKCGNLTNL